MNEVKINKTIKYVNSPSTITVDGVKYPVVNDIREAVEMLKNGITIARFEFGDSMSPVLVSGEYCIVEPIKELEGINNIGIGDAVLCKVGDHLMTHMVLMISDSAYDGTKYLIGNTWMQYYGWTDTIYGIAKGTKIIETPDDIVEV
jgi:hypothetical protein